MSDLRKLENSAELDYSKLIDPISGENVLPAIAVDSARLATDGLAAIRMVGFVTPGAVEWTIASGLATFYSRKRSELWTKGEISGDTLSIRGIYVDCDGDTIIYDVDAKGQTCHTGAESCFELPDDGELS